MEDRITYENLGYNPLLDRKSKLDLSEGITNANVDAIIGDGAISGNTIDNNENWTDDVAANDAQEAAEAAQAEADAAQAEALSKAKIYRQTTAPASGMMAGDIWLDTGDGDRPYSYNGSSWVETLTIIDGGKITTGTIDASVVTVNNINAGNITTGILTGRTVQTSSSGKRVKMYDDKIEIYNGVSGDPVGTFEGISGTYASALQVSIAEIDVLAMDAEAIGYTGINKDALIGVDLGDLRLTTMKDGGGGGDIVLSPESGHSVISYRNIIPNGDGTLYLGNSSYGWGRVYIGSSSRYLYDNSGTLYWNGSPIGGGGETNTASNKGGTGLYYNKTGVNLNFKGISVSSRLSLTSYTDYLYIDHTTGSGYNHIPSGGTTYYSLRNSGSGTASWSRAVYIGDSDVYFDSSGSTITVSQSLSPSGDGTQYLGDSSHGWGRVYIGNGGEYLYESSGIIYTNVGMFWDGNSTCNGTISAVGEMRASNGSIHTSGNIYTGGMSANEGSVNCAVVQGDGGGIWLDYTGRLQTTTHLDPPNGGSYNFGGSTRYWGDISYKTLTDRGCLGWFDDGVELQDGTKVSDVKALLSIKKHSTQQTIYGVPRLDYKTMPKAVYKKAINHKGEVLQRDENDRPYELAEKDTYGVNNDGEKILLYKKDDKIQAEDGAETTALISIMLGAIKELSNRIQILENN